MAIQQISVFLENAPGGLHELISVLEGDGVHIRAIMLSDTSSFGMVRLMLDNNEKGLQLLKEAGFVTNTANVVVLSSEGIDSLQAALEELKLAAINVEYMYGFQAKISHGTMMVMKVKEYKKALKLLEEKQFVVISSEQQWSDFF